MSDKPEAPDVVTAPWTDEQVARLRARQADPRKHEYTCTCGAVLRPERDGWHCDNCSTVPQTWALAADIAEVPDARDEAEIRETAKEGYTYSPESYLSMLRDAVRLLDTERATVATLRRHIDLMGEACLPVGKYGDVAGTCAAVTAELARLRASEARLRSALVCFGHHDVECPAGVLSITKQQIEVCTCGLGAAIAAAASAPPADDLPRRLAEALEQYGLHDGDCAAYRGDACTCGLGKALTEARRAGLLRPAGEG